MKSRATRRGVAACAATTLAIGVLTVFGTSVADAAPVVRDWADGKTSFNRTISNGTPGVGETITVTTKWRRTDNVTETIAWATDVFPPCLTYVPGSATMNGVPITPTVNPNRGGTPPSGIATINGSWANAPGTNNPTYALQYTVGANCAIGTSLATGMDYSGDRGAGYYGFGGPNFTVGKGNPVTTLAPVTGVRVGQSTTLTATVVGGGSASGNVVEFYNGATKLGQGTLDASGIASYAWTPAVAGAYTLSAKFVGTTVANASQSTPQTVQADVTSSIALAPVSGAKAGIASTLTATVSPAGAGGTVEFRDGAAVIGTGTVAADGTATTSWTPAAGGARTLEAVFSGRTGVLGSTTTQDVTVADADIVSSVVLGSVTGAKVGQVSTLTATVSPAAAGGTVTFKDGTTVIGSANVGADGFATTSWTPATDGARTLSAEFSGRAGVLGSATTQDVTVAAADVVSSVELGSVTGAKVGQVSTLTATVNPAGAGGTVEFRDGATVIDTVTVGTDGTASASWSPMTGGARTLEAVFSGREGVLGSTTSQSVTVAEADVASTTTLAPVSGAKVGVASTLTATVSPAAAGGTVTFKDGADVIGTGTVGADGTATTSWTPVTDGVRTVSAEFAGHAGVLASATTQDVTVAAADVASTTTLASVSGAKVGVASTLTATVSPAAVGGTVTFKDGADVIGTGTVAADGTATTPWTPATDGVRILSAEFAGHAGVLASATTQDVTVAAADVASTTTLAPVSGAKVGVASTLTATVSPAAAGGTVEFRDGTELIASVEVGADGTASTVWSPTAGGARTVHAVFSGRNGVLGSNTSQQVTVEAADVASSVLLGSVTGAKAGVATTLTATVSPAAAGGTVEFKDGATVIGTANVGADGIATTSWTPAAGGAHTLEAVFSGRTGVLGSTTSQQVTVEAADVASTTTLAPVSGAKVGQPTTLTATVSPAAAGGSVEFRDGTTVLATVPVAADGTASTSWTPTSGGARTLEAVFSGRTGVLGSTTSQQVTVDAADVASATTLATVSGAKVGQPTTLTATVSPAAAGGTVEFKDGATVIGTGNVGADGRATTTWTPATAGARTLEAEFSGRTGVLGSTTTQQVTVADADVVSSVELAPISGAKVGQITTLKATLSPAAAGGTVTFKEGNTVIGTAIIGADGIATLQWTPTAAGSPVITVEFDGHSTVEAGTDHATVTVAPAGGNGGGFGSLGSLFGGFGS
ncbi:Ig-like domain-containing protein [Rhodococcus hoagii]|nr:Ig-like domain-containing protein [Prescottella equi]